MRITVFLAALLSSGCLRANGLLHDRPGTIGVGDVAVVVGMLLLIKWALGRWDAESLRERAWRTWLRRIASVLLVVLVAGCDGQPLDSYPAPTPVRPQTRPCSMAGLPKSHVTIPLGVGIQSGVDPKLLPPGATAALRNSRVGRNGEIVKRNGMSTIGMELLGASGFLPASWSLGTLGDCLVSLSGSGVDHPANAYSPTANQWATDATNGIRATGRRGPIVAATSRVAGVGREADVAYGSGFYFVTWVDVTSAATFLVYQAGIDAATGKKVFERSVNDGLSSSANRGVRVVNGYAVFVRDTTGGDLAFDRWEIANLDAGPTTTVFATTTSGFVQSPTFDLIAWNATTLTAVYVDGTTNASAAVDFVPSTGVTTAWVPLTSGGLAIPVDAAQNWMQDLGGSGKISLITVGAAAGLRLQWDINRGTAQAAITYVLDAAPGSVGNVVGHTTGNSATGEFTVLYDNSNLSPTAVTKAAIRTGGVVSTATYYRSMALRSKTWKQGSDYYVAAELPSSTQGTRYVLRIPPGSTSIPTPLVAFQVRGGFAGGQTSAVVSPSANTWSFVTTAQIRSTGQPAGYTTAGTGIDMITVSFKQPGDTTMGTPVEAINSLFVPGGTVGQFDGTTYAETGFAYLPETPGAPVLAGGGGLTAGVTYYWKFVYSYLDAYGRVWRSAPSFVLSAAMGANTKATFAVPTLRLTGRSGVLIEVYRGAANDSSTFQKVGTAINDPTVDTVAFADTVSDATQALGEFLYTNGGGVLPNDSIPGFTSIAVAGNRLWGVTGGDLWFSDVFVGGQGLRFSEQKRVVINDNRGDFHAVAAQPNGVVIVLKADAAYAVMGAGPDAAGRGGFTVQMVSSEIGTRNPRSVVETSGGVEFLSTSTRSGWFRINTALTPQYIGSPVQQYATKTIVAAVLLPTRNELRWYASDGTVLVRDMVSDMWSVDTLTGISIVNSASAYGTGAAVSVSDGVDTFIIVDAVVFTDATGEYEHAVETPWLKFADLHGYQRFDAIRGVGETVDGHELTVSLYRDFATTPFLTQTVSPGPIPLWDWEMKYSAKLSALKVRVSYSSDGEGAKISALVVEYKVKQGLRPLAASKRTA